MKIKLETLQHQVDALDAIDRAFPGMDEFSGDPNANYVYANPLIKGRQSENANIDVKMETGTGKTYIYTRLMYDLHQKYGLFKFVIVVPSPSIKEGTRSFIDSDYARQHFSQFYENTRVQLNVINKGDFSKRGSRQVFSSQLAEFVEASRQNPNQIEVLLINSGMLTSKSMSRDDYDQTLLGGESSPIAAIAATRPVVIIDEPHRFSRDQKAYKVIEALQPQLIYRFGATFPFVSKGKSKSNSASEKRDYYRGQPQYSLNAVESFNQGLVKGIDIDYPDISESQANNRYRVKSVSRKELVLAQGGKQYVVAAKEGLSEVDRDFSGNITYEGNSELSNGLELSSDMDLIPGTFAESYQDEIISQALDCHFKTEQENFLRPGAEENAPRVKTLSLFFIDSIRSFRGDDGKGWLAEHFEALLTAKLQTLIDKYDLAITDREAQYAEFLRATLASLKSDHQNVYAGYFSEDRGNSEEDIQAQVDDILKNKEKLLSFKDEQGNWQTRRFLFSKWTLREGWDNPNVFVIAKLRSSGSENSKIQEVGRGLRLPVDETGHRMTQEEWPSRLSLLLGYDEKDFAKTLESEINSDVTVKLDRDRLTDDMIKLIYNSRKQTEPNLIEEELGDQVRQDLLDRKIASISGKFMDDVTLDGEKLSGFDAFIRLYPEVENQTKVAKGKIRDLKKNPDSNRIRLQKSNWNQLKDLWLQLVRRQMIKFDDSVNGLAETVAVDVFKDTDKNIFVLDRPQLMHQELRVQANQMIVSESKSDLKSRNRTIKYGQFLKQLAIQTDLPISLLHQQMIRVMAEQLNNDTDYINEKSLANLIRTFNERFNHRIRTSYTYEPLQFAASTSVFDTRTNDFVDDVPANVLGVYSYESTSDDKYLYNRPPLRYDSADPELEILKRTYGSKIVVFGKLPKRAIKIPRFDNGTTTPDFIFKIEGPDHPLYLIIETKARNMRLGDEEIRVIQKTYFEQLHESGVYYRMATSEQEVNDLVNRLENGENIDDGVTY